MQTKTSENVLGKENIFKEKDQDQRTKEIMRYFRVEDKVKIDLLLNFGKRLTMIFSHLIYSLQDLKKATSKSQRRKNFCIK